MSKPKTEVYWLRFKGGEWVLMRGRDSVRVLTGPLATKAKACEWARTFCRRKWEWHGIPTRLNICRKDGSIAKEASYGADSKRRRG